MLAAVDDYTSRFKALAALRAKDGRVLSGENRKRIEEAVASLDGARTALGDLFGGNRTQTGRQPQRDAPPVPRMAGDPPARGATRNIVVSKQQYQKLIGEIGTLNDTVKATFDAADEDGGRALSAEEKQTVIDANKRIEELEHQAKDIADQLKCAAMPTVAASA